MTDEQIENVRECIECGARRGDPCVDVLFGFKLRPHFERRMDAGHDDPEPEASAPWEADAYDDWGNS